MLHPAKTTEGDAARPLAGGASVDSEPVVARVELRERGHTHLQTRRRRRDQGSVSARIDQREWSQFQLYRCYYC